MELKQYEDAIKSLDEVLKLNPNHIKAMILKGNCYDFLDLNKESLEIYDNIIIKDNNNELAHHLKGQILLKQKEYEKALNEFNIVINLNKKNLETYFYIAICFNKLNKNNEAIEFYNKYINEILSTENEKNNENICIAYYNIGIIYLKQKKFKEAKNSFNKSLEFNTEFVKAKIALLCTENLKDKIDDILSIIDESNKIEDENLYLIKGNILFEQEKYEESKIIYQKILDKNSINEDANCLYKLNKKEEALEKYNQALNINKSNKNALFNKSLIILENGNFEESLKLLDEALKIKSNIYILIQKGICFLKEEKFEEAISIFDEALSIDNKNIRAYLGKGQALFGLNKINESIEEYNKALLIDPNNSDVIISKANSLMRNDSKEEALNLYKKGIDLNKEGDINCINLINYVFCLIEIKQMDEVKNLVEKSIKLYELQKNKLTEKEKDFFEKRIEKIKRKNKRLFK